MGNVLSDENVKENFATFISRSPTISGRTDAVLGPTWSSPLNPLGPRDNIVRRPIEERISGVRSPEVRGTLDGAAVRALPDWGSTANAVSESFARRHHLKIDKSKTRSIPLLGGHFAECIGRVIGNFKFNGEQGVYRREFQVLHTSVHDVILGRSFLDETETLDKHTHRIDHTIRPCFQRGKRLFLMDESPKERIRCAVNGTAASAFPDTGCDLMLVSGEFAGRNGFKVHRGKKYRTDLELIDGSTIRTDGMVLDAELQFDVPPPLTHELDYDKYDSFLSGLSFLTSLGKNAAQTTFICDLHVVEDLPCDLILSFDFIFQNKVFARFRPLFYSAPIRAYQKGIVDMENSLMFVRNKGGKLSWFSRRRRRLPNETNSIPLQNRPTWDDLWEQEIAQRNRIQLWLTGLSEPQKSVEQRNETQRQAIWDRDNPRPPPTPAPSSDQSPRRVTLPSPPPTAARSVELSRLMAVDQGIGT